MGDIQKGLLFTCGLNVVGYPQTGYSRWLPTQLLLCMLETLVIIKGLLMPSGPG